MKKNKAFTLIELISVLVILAILALIVTPLVMNIIKKIRISADKRSIDAYGRSIEIAIASYLLDEGKFPTSINELTIEYSGDEVTYNNVDYYVIKDSDPNESTVTLLKVELLTVAEVNVILWHELTNYRICFVLKGFLLKQA